jgi:hypothetical protein
MRYTSSRAVFEIEARCLLLPAAGFFFVRNEAAAKPAHLMLTKARRDLSDSLPAL